MKKVVLSITAMVLILTSCGEKTEEKAAETTQPTPEVAEVAPAPVENIVKTVVEKPVAVTTESGLIYEILVSSNGTSPAPTSMVTTHYHGTLMDGTVFDSSVDRGEPIQFGVNQVILGWQEALVMMKKGEKWKLTIPPHLAYGEAGAPPSIGPNATLQFEVELIDFQ
jgi:FKBP-type peptidyl-prolyl cis-trans isomerase FklB